MSTQTKPSDKNFPMGIDGYSYADLHQACRLENMYDTFNDSVKHHDAELFAEFETYRLCQGKDMPPQLISDLLIRMAPCVGSFIAKLFQIADAVSAQAGAIQEEIDSIFVYRHQIVGKLKQKFKDIDVATFNVMDIQADLSLLKSVAFPLSAKDPDAERGLSRMAAKLIKLAEYYQSDRQQKDGSADLHSADQQVANIRQSINDDTEARIAFQSALAQAQPGDFIDALLEIVWRWTYVAQHDPSIVASSSAWVSFKEPEKIDTHNLVHHTKKQRDGFLTWATTPDKYKYRDGFSLTDPRFSTRQVLYEVDHCIYCHDRDTDSCSKGMRNKKTGDFKISNSGSAVTGCPLEEKISEMHVLKKQGENIAALALIVIDNPMCPGTGHRICNECMQGCIYQKTEPVNIPQIETNVLTDVLALPWGFEIYSLLTRWNPLNVQRPYALPYNGKNIMVVGLGPAGYTLSHYLINEGFGVVGIDALKIEPLPSHLTGTDGELPTAVRDFSEFYEDMDQRILRGFGGVAEYGITARWDKNFLKIIYLNLVRRRTFNCYGGIRFGGTMTIEDAWDIGFHHIAIASGAGKPTIIDLKNNLLRGIRKASDFLMALQLTGAAKKTSLSNLQIRLPAGVIGGGLTALDTATEIMAYYPIQVEKILYRYEELVANKGEQVVRDGYDDEESIILDEYLVHGRAIQAERKRAEEADETPDFRPLIDQWGGSTLFYRKSIKDSPAYIQNHEEVKEALQEGIQLAECMVPCEAIADEYSALKAVNFDLMSEKDGQWITDHSIQVPLRSLFIAAGTAPNTIYEQENPETFIMDGKFFQRYEPSWNDSELPDLTRVNDTTAPKIGKPAPLTSYTGQGKFVSFYGDSHPVYTGNVVKAMASAKDGYPYIRKLFAHELKKLDPVTQVARDESLKTFFKKLDMELLVTVLKVNRLAPKIVEVLVKAPMQAKKFQPGQFYRVQNFESLAPTIHGTVLAAESLALTGASVDKEKGIISLITLEMGSSSRLCDLWKPGYPLVVMGVTGEATKISQGKTVMLVGGGLGNAVQFSIGKALRSMGNKVIYFAGYRKPTDVFKVKDIEAASDVIVWSVDAATGVEAIKTTRAQDKTFVGNIIESIMAYAQGKLGETNISLRDVDHMIVIGSNKMMEAVKKIRTAELQPYLKPEHTAIGSINSPMQCMMKGICAQCLCKHIDPETGEEYFVYSCYNQDQELDRVDFQNLGARLRQNSVQEKLSDAWLDYILAPETSTN